MPRPQRNDAAERRLSTDERPRSGSRPMAWLTLWPERMTMAGTPSISAQTPPVSVHFVNNALATAAGLLDEDPDAARDVLARLGAFLTHRLRGPRPVALEEELEHVGTYLALEQARFPGRITAELPGPASIPPVITTPGVLQDPIAEAVGRWLRRGEGSVRVALRVRAGGEAVDAQLDAPDDPGAAGERVRVALGREAA
jgi:LytS/YehU family sensor histidine kinase